MASRKTSTETVSPVEAFVALQTFEATEADPVSNGDLADDQKWDHTATFKAMEILADAELVDSHGRGLTTEWFIIAPDVTAENAENVAQEALKDFTPPKPVKATKAQQNKAEKDAEARERLEYATRAAESQDGVMSQAQHEWSTEALKDLDTMAKGEPPVIIQDVPPLTDKVDTTSFSLSVDAPKTDIAIRALADKLKSLTLPDKGLDQFVDSETGDMVYESAIEKNGLKLDEPDSVPEVPAGVNANVWDLAHTAITQTARDYWLRAAAADALLYEENKGVVVLGAPL